MKKAFTLSVLVVRLPSRNGNIAKNQQFLFPTKRSKSFATRLPSRINDEPTSEFLDDADYTLKSADMENFGNNQEMHILFLVQHNIS